MVKKILLILMFIFSIQIVSAMNLFGDLDMKTHNILGASNITADNFYGYITDNYLDTVYSMCPNGSVMIGANRTGRYCDGRVVMNYELVSLVGNWTADKSSYAALNSAVTFSSVNISGDKIYITGPNDTSNKYINFYEDGSATGEQIWWDDTNDRFTVSDNLYIINTLVSAQGLSVSGTNTFLNLNGTGNAVACLTSAGVLYRGNSTGCP